MSHVCHTQQWKQTRQLESSFARQISLFMFSFAIFGLEIIATWFSVKIFVSLLPIVHVLHLSWNYAGLCTNFFNSHLSVTLHSRQKVIKQSTSENQHVASFFRVGSHYCCRASQADIAIVSWFKRSRRKVSLFSPRVWKWLGNATWWLES